MLTYLTSKGLTDAQIQLISGHESKKSLDPSSTVQKVKMLEVSHLDKAKMALALHFRLSRRDHSSRNVGGSAAPEARIAAEACAWS
jgi:hypothetical protein